VNKRIAVVFESDIFDRKGMFNAVHGRIRALAALGGYEIVPFCIQCRDNWLSRKKKHTPKRPKLKEMRVGDVKYNILNYRFSLLDWLLVEIMRVKPLFFSLFVRRTAAKLADFDLISAHSLSGGLVAREAAKADGIPFTITWHGSDIHTHPWKSRLIRKTTAALTAAAACNFYVSRVLLETSSPFPGKKKVLRNGIGSSFQRLPEEERAALRKRYGLSDGTKVVAYAGNFYHVKNTLSLPGIWERVRENTKAPLVFWVIGEGKEFEKFKHRILEKEKLNCVFFGNRPPEEMPALMNCIDVLVLPSFNEGMPLVTMEALSCGCNVVGSRVGGIPETIGEQYTVTLGKNFEQEMAALISSFLATPADQLGGRSFAWNAAARAEDAAYKEILG